MKPLHAPPTSLLDRYRGEDFLPLYTTTVTAHGGVTGHARASGRVRSDDGALDVQLRLPTAMGGEGDGTNPEQLFAAGYAACFHGALQLLATRSKIAVDDARVDATVSFGRDPMDGQYMLTVDLTVHLPGVETSLAETLVRETERLCPYTKLVQQGAAGTVKLAE